MSDRADQIIAALRRGHDHLASRVRRLDTADLTKTSGAAAWDVSQVLGHLGSGAEIALAVLEGALDGSGPKDGDFNKSVWARWDSISPGERAEGFLPANEALVTRYESLGARTREDLRIDLGFLRCTSTARNTCSLSITGPRCSTPCVSTWA
ncbi:maleylpyruvate isomerase N-terminal domain-containing protein [Streptomyces sp. ID05-04B]|uniref:maleylpyruvate isomerase N-terminal domain-containing protein n=1 Tax=Streptomyces sp. ID05-04B TaxID=3028661 RepID=UPI0029C39740|nr:maleylpyruvate isomerase N-terminal domain-containing protein [Streptomyces sp. ID05-04B]MDX5564983.1 maleylpyruvate isomerase N-terminal domain-containing protein [Streptomyces sp. ID05-04B]